jgi:hypothetical protein
MVGVALVRWLTLVVTAHRVFTFDDFPSSKNNAFGEHLKSQAFYGDPLIAGLGDEFGMERHGRSQCEDGFGTWWRKGVLGNI